MKKWYRIGICLVLAVCLLLLSACTGDNNPSASDPVYTGNQASENTENQAGKTDAKATEATGNDPATGNEPTAGNEPTTGNEPTDGNEPTTGNEPIKEPGENAVALTPKVLFISGGKSELAEYYTGLSNGMLLDYESCKAFFENSVNGYTLTYPEEFFEDHSLLLVGTIMGSSSTVMELAKVLYEDGVACCYLEYPYNPEIAHLSDGKRWYCLVEVDTVLPEDTRVIFNSERVTYSKDDYNAKVAQFRAQCLQ